MEQIAIDNLVRQLGIKRYETAFWKATGVPLHVALLGEPDQGLGFGRFKSAFCAMVNRAPGGCIAWLEAERHAQKGAGQKFGPQQITCFAGLTHVRVPVLVGGQLVATVIGGPVCRRQRTERHFLIALKKVIGERKIDLEKKALKAYLETQVVAADRLQAVTHLLNVFAQYLANYISSHAISAAAKEPKIVTGAKQFVQSHLQETITLGLVAQHVKVSRFHFCKMFKKATGMTLTEYVALVRVEKAKALLVDLSMRISEVVFAAGFGSIPRFNSVFKRHVGMSPTEYRGTLDSSMPM